MQRKIRILSLFLAISMLALVLSACGIKSTNSQNALSVKSIVVDKHDLQTNLDISGVLVPNQTANISAKSSGRISGINSQVGRNVKIGDVLVTLDNKELNAQLLQAEAALNSANEQASQAKINLDAALNAYKSTKQLLKDQELQAKINYDLAESAYKRMLDLSKNGSISQNDLDNTKSKYDLAKQQYEMSKVDTGSLAQSQLIGAKSKYDLAQKQYEIASGSALEQAKAAVNNLKVQLENSIIKSPLNGVVINKNMNEGEIASPGSAIITVADSSSFRLKGTVSQETLPLIKEGQKIDVRVDIYPNKMFKGVIDTISPMAVSTGEYFPIEISIKNAGELRAGLTAHASMNLTAHDAIAVPLSAVVQNNGQSYVFEVNNGVLSKRIVTTGLKNDKEIEILGGLAAGEKIAAANVNTLFDNMSVAVK